MQKTLYGYAADIVKYTENDDGTIMVYGKAAGPELDLDEQRCDPTWLKAQMPDWFQWANVRAQHGGVAAGVGKELEEAADGSWFLKSHIVDPDSITKVKTGVYKGYSIGAKGGRIIKTATAPKGLIVGGKIVEVSLVDRPCNPTATLSIVKSAGGLLELDEGDEPDEDDVEGGDDELEADYDEEGDVEKVDDTDGDPVKGLRADFGKGFIMDLLSGKNDKKPEKKGDGRHRDRLGQFAREKARAEKEAKRKAKADADAKTDAEHAEKMNDAANARRSGRPEEAAEHLAGAAAHTRTNGQRRAVRQARGHTAAALIREKAATPDEVAAWVDDIEELIGAYEGVLPYDVLKAALATVSDVLDDADAVIEKALAPDGANPLHAVADLIAGEAVQLREGFDSVEDLAPLLAGCRALLRLAGGEIAKAAEASLLDEYADIEEPDLFDLDKAVGASATVVDAGEITKAVMEAKAPLEAELVALRGKLAKIEATPVPGGPFVMSAAPITKAASSDSPGARWLAEADKTTDPVLRTEYLARAARAEAGASS